MENLAKINNLITTKTIILTDGKNGKFKAILNLKKGNELSKIQFFSKDNFAKSLVLGLGDINDLIKIPLEVKNEFAEFYLPKNVILSQDIACAILDVSNGFCPEVVLKSSNIGSSEVAKIENYFTTKKPQNTSVLYTESSQEEIENIVESNLNDDMNSTYFDACSNCKYREAFYSNKCPCERGNEEKFIKKYDNVEKNELRNKNIDISKDNDLGQSFFINCNEKTVAENFGTITNETNNLIMENNEITRKSEEKVAKNDENEITNEEDNYNFFQQIKSQIQTLFSKYPTEKTLEKIVPLSKWVKVNYDNDDNFYVLGLIFDENSDENIENFKEYAKKDNIRQEVNVIEQVKNSKINKTDDLTDDLYVQNLDFFKNSCLRIKYICYGIPANKKLNPPKELEGYADWLPTNQNDIDGNGFWIVCQDGSTGNTLPLHNLG